MELARYGGAGLVGTGVHYAVLTLLLKSTTLTMISASTLGAVMGAAVNYYLNYFFTFHSTRSHRQTFLRFWMVALLSWVINAAMLLLTLKTLDIKPILNQLIATGATFFVTFYLNRKWTF